MEKKQTQCLSLPIIAHCIEYVKKEKEKREYMCQECLEEFYYDEVEVSCKSRLRDDPHCDIYEEWADSCKFCRHGYVLDKNNLCVNEPFAVENCKKYNPEKKCVKCSDHFILKDNFCIAVKEEKKIENCFKYKEDSSCAECRETYFLIQKECVKSKVQHCKVFEDINNCKECEDGYVFH